MATQSRTPKIPDPRVEKRKEQLEEIEKSLQNLEEYCSVTQKLISRLSQLENVTLGLYDEIDKLTKKAPAESVTDLVLESINDIVGEAKELSVDDPYVSGLKEFVAAGDNPQHRDAVITLRRVKDRLVRNKESYGATSGQARNLLVEGRLIEAGLRAFLKSGYSVSQEELRDWVEDLPLHLSHNMQEKWFCDTYPKTFNFDRLDRLNVTQYFSLN